MPIQKSVLSEPEICKLLEKITAYQQIKYSGFIWELQIALKYLQKTKLFSLKNIRKHFRNRTYSVKSR